MHVQTHVSIFLGLLTAFTLDVEQRALLAAMLKPGDPSEGRLASNMHEKIFLVELCSCNKHCL